MKQVLLKSNTRAKCLTNGCPGNIIGMPYEFTLTFTDEQAESATTYLIKNIGNTGIKCPICAQSLLDGNKVFILYFGKVIKQLQLVNYSEPLLLSFTQINIESMLTNASNEHMNSTVEFSVRPLLAAPEEAIPYTAIVRQPAGESFSYEKSPLEVVTPSELQQKITHNEFRDAVEEYYRATFGLNGKAISITEEATDSTIRDVFLTYPYVAIINGRTSPGHGGW